MAPKRYNNGARANLVGVRTRLGNTPQHGVLFGMTGAGKSVIIADLLAQIGHLFGFRLIVEEGLSHGVLTRTQGCKPVLINPNSNRRLVSGFEEFPNIEAVHKYTATLNELKWFRYYESTSLLGTKLES